MVANTKVVYEEPLPPPDAYSRFEVRERLPDFAKGWNPEPVEDSI
jgi:hypothetical protein